MNKKVRRLKSEDRVRMSKNLIKDLELTSNRLRRKLNILERLEYYAYDEKKTEVSFLYFDGYRFIEALVDKGNVLGLIISRLEEAIKLEEFERVKEKL